MHLLRSNEKSQARPVIAIVGGGLLQLPFIQEVKKAGLDALVIDGNEQAPGRDQADVFLHISTRDKEGIIGALKPYSARLKYCATVATDMTATVAAISDFYRLNMINSAQALVTTDKAQMRHFLTDKGFPQPRFTLAKTKEEAYQWVERHYRPTGFVIKPVHNMGARGVVYFKHLDQLSYVFEMAQSQSLTKDVIIEDYIEAHEISVDALVINGRVELTGVADRIIELKENKYFVETGHTMPSAQPASVVTEIKSQLEKFARCLGALAEQPYTGALKGDIRVRPGGQVIIGEIASRLSGGFMSTHTYPAASSHNLMAAYLQVLQGSYHPRPRAYNRVSIERAIISPPGRLVKINEINIDNWQKEHARLLNVFYHFKPGDIINPVTSNIGKLANLVIEGDSFEATENLAREIKASFQYEVECSGLTQKEIDKKARKTFNNKYCWVCKNCDGTHCASSIPGMGAIGSMSTFQDNSRALNEYFVSPGFLDRSDSDPVQPSLDCTLFDRVFSGPLLSAPITGSQTNMGGSITEFDYAYETAEALRQLNLLPAFGDGASHDKYLVGLAVMQEVGRGLPVFKPRKDLNQLKRRIKKAEALGAIAWGVDIDAVYFKTMLRKGQATSRKSLNQLQDLAAMSSIPFFLKGIMTEGDAEIACEAGASAIIVSNHGGRVLDAMPGTARVLPAISKMVKSKFPGVKVLADGGIRSGSDIFKMLCLGADAVLVGRPLVMAAVAHGRFAVRSLVERYLEELKRIMIVSNCQKLSDLHPAMLQRFS